MTNQNTDSAHRLVVNGVALLAAFTLLGMALLIYFWNQPRTELWASRQTIEAKPSLEIVP